MCADCGLAPRAALFILTLCKSSKSVENRFFLLGELGFLTVALCKFRILFGCASWFKPVIILWFCEAV